MRPLAPGTSASLAGAGAANGARGPGGGGAGGERRRGAVTSREGVGAAREPADDKPTRGAAAGVAGRRLSAVSCARACSFDPSPPPGAPAAAAAPQLCKKVQKLGSGAAGSRAVVTSGIARALRSLHLSWPPPPPPGIGQWADPGGGGGGGGGGVAPAVCTLAWVPLAAAAHVRGGPAERIFLLGAFFGFLSFIFLSFYFLLMGKS